MTIQHLTSETNKDRPKNDDEIGFRTKTATSPRYHQSDEILSMPNVSVAVSSITENVDDDDDYEIYWKESGFSNGVARHQNTYSLMVAPPLIGRETEQVILWNTWNAVVNQTDEGANDRVWLHQVRTAVSTMKEDGNGVVSAVVHHILEIHGPSGVGKSHLVDSIRERVVEETKGIFVSSKFHQLSSAGRRFPFHVIVDILSDICEVLAMRSDAKMIGMSLLHDTLSPSECDLFINFVSVPSILIPTKRRSSIKEEESKSDADVENTIIQQEGREQPKAGQKAATNNKQLSLDYASTSDPFGRPCRETEEETDEDDDDDEIAGAFEYSAEPFKRLQRACREFLIFVSKLQPLLIFLDDIQWADEECMSMINSLFQVTEEEGIPILFVVARRSTSMSDDAAALVTTSFPGNARIMVVENWTLSQVEEFMSRLLSIPCKEVRDSQVGTIVYEKTEGNPFFVQQFLELLRIQKLMKWSSSKCRWKWSDVEGIVGVDVSSGVLSSVDARLSAMNPKARSILILASHLGYQFRTDVLRAVVMASDQGLSEVSSTTLQGEEKEILEEALEIALEDRLIVHGRDENSYLFMHDRVQESLYDMVTEGEPKERMYLRIGKCLDALVALREEDEIIILCTDCFNEGRRFLDNGDDVVKLLQLNAKASRVASSAGAFSSAAEYLTIALSLLPPDTLWSSQHYELALRIHESLAQMHCNCGKPNEAHRVLDTIMGRALSIDDKQTAYEIRFVAYGLDGSNDESLDVALMALGEVGIHLPKDPSLIKSLGIIATIHWLMRGRTPSDLLNLPAATDTRAEFIHSLLRHVAMIASLTGKENLLIRASVEAFISVLRSGRTKWTPSATALYGVIQFAISRDIGKAHEMSQVSIAMVSAFHAECDRAFASLLALYALRWKLPLSSAIEPLKGACESGIRNGDAYHAINALGLAMAMTIFVGRPLVQAEKDMKYSTKRISQFAGKKSVLLWSNSLWQFMLNLLGRSADPLKLTGDVMDERNMVFESHEGLARFAFLCIKLQLACHFHSIHSAELTLDKIGQEKVSIDNLAPDFVTLKFFSAITHLDLVHSSSSSSGTFRSSRRWRHHFARARQIYRMFERLVSNDCHYAASMIGILQAEMAYIRSGTVDQDMYDAAIDTAVQAGFPNNAGFACERAAFALLDSNRTKDDPDVRSYVARAIYLNQIWQAFGKVEWLERTFSLHDGSVLADLEEVNGVPIDIVASSLEDVPASNDVAL